MRKILLVLLALLVLATGLCGQILATEPTGSITFLMNFDGTPLDGGKLNLCRVGQLTPAGDGFMPVEQLRQEDVSLENLEDPELAKTLRDLAFARGLKLRTAPIEKGQAVFSKLKPGLYVVSQGAGEETPGYAPVDPFLISLPQWQDGGYVYDLTASPKVPLVPAPTQPTEPPGPDEPELPYTGQLNWPIPVMTALGLLFLGLGWFLLFFGKRRRV